jgi:hypothetical protein
MRCSMDRGAGPPHAGAANPPRATAPPRGAKAGAGAVVSYQRRAYTGA